MKKRCLLLLGTLLCLFLCACGGNVDTVATHEVASDLYSPQEIQAAMDVVTRAFDRTWNGCTLTELYYAGDEMSKAHQDWADRSDADETLVLLSSFDVDASGGDGSLNPNSTYEDFMWILVRTDGGSWKHVDHGY